MSNLIERWYALLGRYNDGTEPLESWTTEDLSELETLVNAELQERYNRAAEEYDQERFDPPYWDDADEWGFR